MRILSIHLFLYRYYVKSIPDCAQALRRVFVDVGFFGVDSNTGGEMFGFDFDELRDDFFAFGNRVRAARVEMTAFRRIDGRRNIAG